MIIVFQQRKTVRTLLPAEFEFLSFIDQAKIVVIAADVHHTVFHQTGLGNGRTGLPGFEQRRIFGHFQYFKMG